MWPLRSLELELDSVGDPPRGSTPQGISCLPEASSSDFIRCPFVNPGTFKMELLMPSLGAALWDLA